VTSSTSSAEVIDDATLEQLFFGGRTQSSSVGGGEGGLTPAQEDVLYREGTIPSAEKAEALVAAAEKAELENTDSTEVQNPGHKFGLPKRPWPQGFNLKKRYHPVLEQITRLLMKDGKLSVAQRVSSVYDEIGGNWLTNELEYGYCHELPPNRTTSDL
jgi:small subunit ribosomal protein S7